MKSSTAYILLTLWVMAALFVGSALAQSAANVGLDQPTIEDLIKEAGSRENASVQINPKEAGVSTDVTKVANLSQIFTSNAGEPVNITAVNFGGPDRWVNVVNNGITNRNLSGWSLLKNGQVIYTFQRTILDTRAAVRVHQGAGQNTATDLYMNSNVPLFGNPADNITLVDNTGKRISTYTILRANAAGVVAAPAGITQVPNVAPMQINATNAGYTTAAGTTGTIANANANAKGIGTGTASGATNNTLTRTSVGPKTGTELPASETGALMSGTYA